MEAEIIFSIESNQLLQILEDRENLNLSANNEYVMLKPRMVNDNIEFKVLYSNTINPTKWVGFNKIRDEWNDEIKESE